MGNIQTQFSTELLAQEVTSKEIRSLLEALVSIGNDDAAELRRIYTQLTLGSETPLEVGEEFK